MEKLIIDKAEFDVERTLETFVSLFRNEKGDSMSISLSGSGAPFASTTKIPPLKKEWFRPATDEHGNVIPNRMTSRFPLIVAYSNLRRGTKSTKALFVNVSDVHERPMATSEELDAIFGSVEAPKSDTPEQANAAASEEEVPF